MIKSITQSIPGRECAVVVLILFCLATRLSAQATQPIPVPTPVPTMSELHQMYDSGDFRTCLQQVNRVLRLSLEKRSEYDVDQLNLLRGGSLLCLSDPRTAKRWLTEAARSKDSDTALRANALLELIAHADKTTYAPIGNSAPIDFSKPENQPGAMQAIVKDEYAPLEKKVKQAVASDTLELTMKVLPEMLKLHAAEKVATGKTERTGPLARELGEHAREIMTRELIAQDQRIGGLEALSTRVAGSGGYYGGGWNGAATSRGLTSDERNGLYDLLEYLEIESTAKQGEAIARANDGNVEAWSALVDRAVAVRAHAQAAIDSEGIKYGND